MCFDECSLTYTFLHGIFIFLSLNTSHLVVLSLEFFLLLLNVLVIQVLLPSFYLVYLCLAPFICKCGFPRFICWECTPVFFLFLTSFSSLLCFFVNSFCVLFSYLFFTSYSFILICFPTACWLQCCLSYKLRKSRINSIQFFNLFVASCWEFC